RFDVFAAQVEIGPLGLQHLGPGRAPTSIAGEPQLVGASGHGQAAAAEVLDGLRGVAVTGVGLGEPLAQRKGDAVVFGVVPAQVGHRLADGALVAVGDRQRDADLHAGRLHAELVVITGDGLHLDVRDRLDALATDHDLIAADLRQRRLDLGAVV